VTKRGRILWFGGAGVVALAGVVAALVDHSAVGQILAVVLISLGLVLGTALVFYEVGRSEDRERAREAAARAPRARRPAPRRSHLGRMRGSRRGLR
jgi:membrane protein implicated in regulation of membrane protease activity